MVSLIRNHPILEHTNTNNEQKDLSNHGKIKGSPKNETRTCRKWHTKLNVNGRNLLLTAQVSM